MKLDSFTGTRNGGWPRGAATNNEHLSFVSRTYDARNPIRSLVASEIYETTADTTCVVFGCLGPLRLTNVLAF